MKERIHEAVWRSVIGLLWWAAAHPYLLGLALLGVCLLPSSWGPLPGFGIGIGARSELASGLITGVVIAVALQHSENRRRDEIRQGLLLLPSSSRRRIAHALLSYCADVVGDIVDYQKRTGQPFLDLQGRQWTHTDLYRLQHAVRWGAHSYLDGWYSSPAGLGGSQLLLAEIVHELMQSLPFQSPSLPLRPPSSAHLLQLEAAVTRGEADLNRAAELLAIHGEARAAAELLRDRDRILALGREPEIWHSRTSSLDLVQVAYGTPSVEAVRAEMTPPAGERQLANWTHDGQELHAWIAKLLPR